MTILSRNWSDYRNKYFGELEIFMGNQHQLWLVKGCQLEKLERDKNCYSKDPNILVPKFLKSSAKLTPFKQRKNTCMVSTNTITIVQEYQKIDVSSMIGYECSLRCVACNEQKQSQTDWDRQDEDEPNCHVSESWEKNKDRKLRWVANNYVILVILRLRAHGTGLCSVVSNRKQSRNTINQYLWINLNWYY